MGKKIVRLVIMIIGAAGGLALGNTVDTFLRENSFFGLSIVSPVLFSVAMCAVFCVVLGAIAFIIAPWIMRGFAYCIGFIVKRLTKIPIIDLFYCVIGLIIGLTIAFLLSFLIDNIPGEFIALIINIISYVMCTSICITILIKRKNDIHTPIWFKRNTEKNASLTSSMKVIDTSAIIDGRICDIAKTGFIEGTLVIPQFVLDELRHVSDSADALKRNRGRRGLDILKQIQDDGVVHVMNDDRDYDDIAEVDAKVLRLATELNAVVITTDYNLNKVASVQKVPVLNINDLANAIKTILIPGEELTVTITREGKEHGQGLAYLDDGTMIVVDGGKACLGKQVGVCVTSVLQTSAGRMVFAKLSE